MATYKAPLVDEDSISTITLTVSDGINESLPDYVDVLIKNVENHIELNVGGHAILDNATPDFNSGEYLVNVRIFAQYDYAEDGSSGIDINEISVKANLSVSDDFEYDPNFNELKTPIELEEFTISNNSMEIFYKGTLVDVQGSVSGTLVFEQPIDFHNLATKGLPNLVSNTMTVTINDTVFDRIV